MNCEGNFLCRKSKPDEYCMQQRSLDAGVVTDMLMNELVGDTAAELHRQQTENIVDRHSAFLRDAPSVETLLHRLHVIEVLWFTAFSVRPETLIFGADLCFTARVFFYYFAKVSPNCIGQSAQNFAR